MNKKFFTLLVALLATFSMGVSAQVTVGTAPTVANMTTGKYYLLQVDGGDAYLSVNTGGLVTVNAASLTTYGALQNALWEVTTKTGTGSAPVTYQFKNKATETYLAMDNEAPLTNELGGAVSVFLSSEGIKNNTAQYFYSYVDDTNTKVFGIANGAVANTIVLKETTAPAGLIPANGFVTIQPMIVSGSLPLNANDINTYMGRQGVYTSGQFLAQADSYIQLSFDPENTLVNPMTGKLQAEGVTVTGAETALATAAVRIASKPYQDETQPWVALKDEAGKYLVVDTLIIPGTEQFSTPKMGTTTDAWHGTANTKTAKRLLDSYLFKFTYNATDNTVSIASRAYRYKANATADADNYKWYSDVTTSNVLPTDVAKGNIYLNGIRYNVATEFTSDMGTEPAALGPNSTPAEVEAFNDWYAANPFMNYFTFASLANTGTSMAVVYTWGDEALDITLDASAWYVQKQLTSGVYLLQVVGSRVADKEGKYYKMSLGGQLELVKEAPRQNFQHMPSAQWVIDATTLNKTAEVTNREFEYELFDNNTTYGVEGQTNQFFYLGEDTLNLIPVTTANKADKYLGYYNLGDDEYSYLNRFSFEYLHELLMDQPVATKADALNTLAVSKDGQASNYTLVKTGTTNFYGYGEHLPGVAQLERDVYRVAVYETLETEATLFVTYDQANKQYHLTDEPGLASHFLLKENNEETIDGVAKCYYTLLEAPMFYANIGIAASTAAVGDPVSSVTESIDYLLNAMKPIEDDEAYFLAVYNNVDKRWEVADAPVVDPFVGYDYASVTEDNVVTNIVTFNADQYDYAVTKVSVDNNTLILTNGVLEDHNQEVANSAFAVGRDKSVIYREVGLVEDEVYNEDVDGYKIKIFRANATSPEYLYEDANSANYSLPVNGENVEANRKNGQMNFLGVEGKGDDVFDRAAVIARYVRGTVMPQYLLMVDYQRVAATEGEECPICAALPESERPEYCPHDIVGTDGYATARVLVNLNDSIAAYEGAAQEKFKWNDLSRLAFVDAFFTDNDTVMSLAGKNIEYEVKWADDDFTASEGLHTDYLHAFRLIDGRYDKEAPASYNDFLIETANESKLAGMWNYWIKVQNGVPVLSEYTNFNDAITNAAERWNLEVTDDAATSNGGIEAGQVQVIAGQGSVTIKGAAGQQVAITNILGQSVYSGIVANDEVTVAAPAGVVVVSVAGEATKALVK